MKKQQVIIKLHTLKSLPQVNIAPDNVFLDTDGKGGYDVFIGEKGFKPLLVECDSIEERHEVFNQLDSDVSQFKAHIHVKGFTNYALYPTVAGNITVVKECIDEVVLNVLSSKVKTSDLWTPVIGVRRLYT